MQGGVKNYLGKQKTVKAPLHWRSGPKHPSTELAYITKKEKDLLIKKDLHRSLKGGVNRGPSGIISLNGWGSRDSSQNRAGQDISAGMDKSASDKGWGKGSGFTNKDAISPATEKAAEAAQNARLGIDPTARQNKWGGLGGLLRGALGVFGGIPGRIFGALSNAKNWAKNKAVGIGEEVDEFGNYPTLDRYLNRKTDKYKDKPYLGQGQSNYSFDGPTEGNDLGLAINRQNAPIGPGLRVGQAQGYYGKGSQYDPNRFQNTNITGGTNLNDFQGVNFTDQIEGTDNIAQLIANREAINTAPSFQDGGRIGYQGGELVEQETDLIQGPQGGEEFQETVVEGQEQPSREQLEALAIEIFQLPLEELDDQQLLVVYQEAMQGQPMEEAVQEEDVQFAANGGLAGLL